MTKSKRPTIGARALHKSGHLDSREVVEVSDDRQQIKIQINSLISGWLPAKNYVYIRTEG